MDYSRSSCRCSELYRNRRELEVAVIGGNNIGTNIEVGDTVIFGDVSLRVRAVTDQGHLVLPKGMAADMAIVDVRNVIIIPKVASNDYF